MDELQQAYQALRREYAERIQQIALEGSEADLTRLNTEMAQRIWDILWEHAK